MVSILRLFFLAVATFLGGLLITLVAPLKLFSKTQHLGYRLAAGIAGVWADFMRWLLTTLPIQWVITGEKLNPKGTYLVLANHQSWIDIMMVMVVLGKGTTLPRFFMKWELVYMPVINICAWALDFPIMRRYTQEDIKGRPELKNRDFDYAHDVLSRNPDQACVVVNYAEGTRFTPEKHRKNRSPYQHLLKPKVGGPQLALDCLRNRLDGIVDITLAYPGATLSVWHLLSGQV
ncbi:MAG TPA: acyltransferase, partial [Gammaproteobacteria bacterium]|nr:acyltransferase [Gammaproteobacteria bacterium]